LRAATSLAQLLRDQSRAADALALLQPIYDRFTEGFDTADLENLRHRWREWRPPAFDAFRGQRVLSNRVGWISLRDIGRQSAMTTAASQRRPPPARKAALCDHSVP
jgi:hypothetical protein